MYETAGEVLGITKGSASSIELAAVIERGFPRRTLDRVKTVLALTDQEIAVSLGISQRTVTRLRKSSHHLSARLSDLLYRIARLFAIASHVLGGDETARDWFRSPQLGLNGRAPLELVTTEVGAREVEDLLGRIEYGVIS